MKPHSITGCGFFIQAEYVVEQGRALLSEGFGQVAEARSRNFRMPEVATSCIWV